MSHLPIFLIFLVSGRLLLSADRTQLQNEQARMASSFAATKLDMWQKRLHLQDWTITAIVVPADSLKPRTLGNIHWDRKAAVIRVLDPADYKVPVQDALRDIEVTIVHELVHLELSGTLSELPRNDGNRTEEEHAVNRITEALLRIY